MSSALDGIKSVGYTGYDLYNKGSKLNDIKDAGGQIFVTLSDERLPTEIKVAQSVAGGTFIAARTTELAANIPTALPLVNIVATTSDVGRTIVYDFTRGREEEDIIARVRTKILSGVSETFMSLAAIPHIPFRAVYLCVGGFLAINSWYSYFQERPAQQLRLNHEGLRDL